MIKYEYYKAEKEIRSIANEAKDVREKITLEQLLNLLSAAFVILFPGGAYSPVKWYQFKRWFQLGSLLVKFIKHIINILNK